MLIYSRRRNVTVGRLQVLVPTADLAVDDAFDVF